MASNPDLYLVIDQGGQSSRALLFKRNGEILAQASVPITTLREGPDRVEHPAEAMITSIDAAVKQAIEKIDPAQLKSIGLACQRSSIVCWDRHSGSALSPVLSWQDRRAGDTLAELPGAAADIHSLTGLFLSPHYGASKLRWCLDHIDPVRRAHALGRLALGPLSSFILCRLLDERPLLVDPVSASRTLLWNLQTRDWSTQLLGLFDIPRDCLPRCVPNRFNYGHMRIGNQSIPLTVSTGDQSAALYMSGPPEPDTVYINIGTGAFLQRAVGNKPLITPGLLSSVVWQSDSELSYVLEGTVNGAASALQKIREELGIAESQMQTMLSRGLQTVPEPPLYINAVSGVGSPYWLSDLESRFIGGDQPTGKLVAVLESIIFLVQANLDAMAAQLDAPQRIVVSGGLSAMDGLCQRLASLSGLAVDRSEHPEATARGLAFLLCQSSRFAGVPHVRFTPERNLPLEKRYTEWRSLMDREHRSRQSGT